MAGRPARPNTIHRPRNQARLILTLDVTCELHGVPNWQSDAIDVLRALDQDELLDRLRTGKSLKPLGIKVLSGQVEVAK